MPQWAVQAPDGKVIQFPDSFTERDVNQEMYKMYATPPGVPRPQPNMQEWGGTPSPTAGLPGSSPNPVAAGPGYTAAVGIPLAAAGAAAVAPAGTATALGRAAWWAAKRGAAAAAISQARKIPVVGKYIPSSAEIIPFFYNGGGAGEVAKTAATTAAAGEAEALANKVLQPEATAMRPPETPAPYRYGPGQIAPESTAAPNARVLAGNQGVITTPRGLLAAGEAAEQPAAARVPVQNAPYTPSGESAARQILGGLDNAQLLKIAKSRGISVTAEAQLKAGVANNRIINKIIDDMKPEELEEIRSRWIESTRMGLPSGIGSEAYQTAAQQTYFPEMKVSKARLGRMEKALANRGAQ